MVDRHRRTHAQFVIKFREWQNVNFVLHIAYTRSVLDNSEGGSLVRVTSGLAGDRYDAISHRDFEIVKCDPIANPVIAKPIGNGFAQFLIRNRDNRLQRDEIAHALNSMVLATYTLGVHLFGMGL